MSAPSVERVQTGTGPETIRALVAGLLPDTYLSGGALVHVETVSGASVNPAADEDCPLPVSASPVTPAVLAGLLAEHAYVYRRRSRKDGTGAVEGRPRRRPRSAISHNIANSRSAATLRHGAQSRPERMTGVAWVPQYAAPDCSGIARPGQRVRGLLAGARP